MKFFAGSSTDELHETIDRLQATLTAIGTSQAVVDFSHSGMILSANENFLKLLGYTMDEVKGRHHSLFIAPHEAQSEEYRQFWRDLAAGKYRTAEYKRLGKGGREVWIQASYNPIIERDGICRRVIKIASDVTESRRRYSQAAKFRDYLRSLWRLGGGSFGAPRSLRSR